MDSRQARLAQAGFIEIRVTRVRLYAVDLQKLHIREILGQSCLEGFSTQEECQ